MKKYKVVWYESVTKGYHTEVEATSAEIAKLMIDMDIDEARTSVIEEDHEVVEDWEVLEVTEIV
jgi:hypothetical protein